ncbi:hypothetical protein L7E84_004700 [Salmonella enterica]|nr:hypothetical protein [Salmonella enterica]
MAGSILNTQVPILPLLYSAAGNPWVIVGAFAGSVIFIVSEVEYTHWAKFGLFASSMIIGISSSELIASLISYCIYKYLGLTISVPGSVGATISAVMSVRILMYISNPKNESYSLMTKISKGLKK